MSMHYTEPVTSEIPGCRRKAWQMDQHANGFMIPHSFRLLQYSSGTLGIPELQQGPRARQPSKETLCATAMGFWQIAHCELGNDTFLSIISVIC